MLYAGLKTKPHPDRSLPSGPELTASASETPLALFVTDRVQTAPTMQGTNKKRPARLDLH